MGSIRLLIVEDHTALAENISEFFEGEEFLLDFATDGLTALHLVAVNQYDVVVLDIMLPGVNGFEICRRIRNDLSCSTPIIMMTAKGELEDKATGFNTGADDYLVKPFELRELQLRIEALYRRATSGNSQTLQAGNLSFDPGKLMVSLDGEELLLSGMPVKIFETLLRAYPNFVSYEELRSKIWGDAEVEINVLRTHVYTLRKQLQQKYDKTLIKTIHGRGFQLAPSK